MSKGPWSPLQFGKGRSRPVRYRASFWDGDAQRRFEKDCDDVLYEREGRLHFLNTSSNVSYFGDLLKAAR